MKDINCKFSVGQLIHHLLFDYRGVIVDIDPEFQSSEDWYQQMARSKPPKDKPWYHILVHNAEHMTYVAERNLEAETSDDAIDNPMVERFFQKFEKGKYERIMS